MGFKLSLEGTNYFDAFALSQSESLKIPFSEGHWNMQNFAPAKNGFIKLRFHGRI